MFAFFAAGVSLAGAGGLGARLADSVTLGVIVGLVGGKVVGVLGSTWLVQRFTRAQLDEGLSWWDVLGLALLAGVVFTVSLLVGELAYGAGSERDVHLKLGALAGSLLLATVVLRARNRGLPSDMRRRAPRRRRLGPAAGFVTGSAGHPDAIRRVLVVRVSGKAWWP